VTKDYDTLKQEATVAQTKLKDLQSSHEQLIRSHQVLSDQAKKLEAANK
jgi:hypothetical protein